MKVIQITNRDDDWGAGYRQYYFGVYNDMGINTYTFLIANTYQAYQYVSDHESTEITWMTNY